jgi:hypothetical protein
MPAEGFEPRHAEFQSFFGGLRGLSINHLQALASPMVHVGFIVHDRGREDDIFRTVLGFKPYWFGGMRDDVPTWISLQVPDSTRAEIMELHAIGKPCCSPFTAADPSR